MSYQALGIDGGGAHTTACLLDAESGRAAYGEAGACNPHVVGLEAALDAIEAAARGAMKNAQEDESTAQGDEPAIRTGKLVHAHADESATRAGKAVPLMVCCLSGAGRREEQEAIAAGLARRGLAERIEVCGDGEATLASGAVLGAGIAVIAGTGSFVWGRDAQNKTARADGWGSLLGDESGGFGIALEGLRAACRCHDGRGGQTHLLPMALEHYGVESASGLIAQLASPAIPRDKIAEFAPRVFEAGERMMDATAVEIIERAAAGLVQSAAAVRRKLFALDKRATLVAGGQLLRRQCYYQERFLSGYRSLFPQDEILFPEDPLSLGAARLAQSRVSGLAARDSELGNPEVPLANNEPRTTIHDSRSPIPESRVPGPESRTPSPESRTTNHDSRSTIHEPRTPSPESRAVFDECRALLTEQRHPDAVGLDEMETLDVLRFMNREDARVAPAVEKELPQIAQAVERIVETFRNGGRLFYIGAGTSGRLGSLDAAECPPTFGTPPEMVQAVIAGGVATLLSSREGAEDRAEEAERDLAARGFNARDMLVGLAASRRTPYVIAGLKFAHGLGAHTVLITCSPPEEPMEFVDILIAPTPGPEAVMGSTRLKAGTAQKMVLNMLTTAAMIRMGKVYQGMMVDMQMSCGKLSERAKRIVMMLTGAGYERAEALLRRSGGSVKRALVMAESGCSLEVAEDALRRSNGFVGPAIQRLQTR